MAYSPPEAQQDIIAVHPTSLVYYAKTGIISTEVPDVDFEKTIASFEKDFLPSVHFDTQLALRRFWSKIENV